MEEKEEIFLHHYTIFKLVVYKKSCRETIFNCADDGDWKLVKGGVGWFDLNHSQVISTCFLTRCPMFVFFSLSMEIPVNGGRSATAICFHNPVNNIFHCFSCVFFVCFRFREWTSQKSCGRSSSRSWSSTGNLRHQATNENYIFLSRCIVVKPPTVYIFFPF
jgi:hypothetical protein